jgi:hypothetical protein
MFARRAVLALLAVFVLALILAGCGSKKYGVPMGTVNMRLTDAPAAFDAVNLVVTQVSIHRAGGESPADSEFIDDDHDDGAEADSEFVDNDHDDGETGGWEVIKSDPTTYDLLALRNGVLAALGTLDVPAGKYTQIRLKIGVGSTVVIAGESHPLVIPSGAQSGLKLIHPFVVPAGGVIDVTLDLDAERSITQSADGSWRLNPTVKITSAAQP